MTSTRSCAQPGRPGFRDTADPSMSGRLITDLERFWPSRRGHAFDELCR